MSNKRQRRRFYALAVILPAAGMLIIVIVFTLTNFNSTRAVAEEFTKRLGTKTLAAIEAGAGTGILEGGWELSNLQRLIEEETGNPEVEWIGLVDVAGRVAAHSNRKLIGVSVQQAGAAEAVWRDVAKTGETHSFIVEGAEGRKIYEIWKTFIPFPDKIVQSAKEAQRRPIGKALLEVFAGDEKRPVIFIGMSLNRYLEIRKRDTSLAVLAAVDIFLITLLSVYFILRKSGEESTVAVSDQI
jgi:two-component system sensor histidine kinase HydH